MTGVSSPPCTDKLKMVLWPVLLCRILLTSFGFTETATASLIGTVQHGRRQALHAQDGALHSCRAIRAVQRLTVISFLIFFYSGRRSRSYQSAAMDSSK